MEVLDDETAAMVWRITASNVDTFNVPRPVTKEGVVEAYGKAKRKMLPNEPNSGRPSHLMVLAESNRRGLGSTTNWSRAKALHRLFLCELGFDWDDPADGAAPDHVADEATAADPPNFRYKKCGARVINYISANPQGYRDWKAGGETREDQDAGRAMGPVARVEEGHWGQCAKAIMQTGEDADVDMLQVGKNSSGENLFDDLDPSVQDPPCMAGLAFHLAAAKCKKFALGVAADVSGKISNMCQSGMGNLANRMQACMSTGSRLSFPGLDDAETDEGGMRTTGSAPADFIRNQIEMYWYRMVVSTDLLMASVRTMPTDAQAGGEQGSNTQLRTPRSGGTPGGTPRGNKRKNRSKGKGRLTKASRPGNTSGRNLVTLSLSSSEDHSGSESEDGQSEDGRGKSWQAITAAAKAVQGKHRRPGKTDDMIAASGRISDVACRTREAEAQTAELKNTRVHEEEFDRRVTQLEGMVKANATVLRVGMAAKRVCAVGARTENAPADVRALVREVVMASDAYAALAGEYAEPLAVEHAEPTNGEQR